VRETFPLALWSNERRILLRGRSMKFSRFRFIPAWVFCLCSTVLAAGPAAVAASPEKAILPQEFAGWQIQGAPQTSQDPMVADLTNAGVLKEYGFTDFAAATYFRDDGRALKIRAARFADASGAFGAYTFYLQPNMAREQIGDQGASFSQRVLFYRGHVLVDALFSKETAMSAAELRELAGKLPIPTGNAGRLPPVLAFMPTRGYIANTEKYAMGPKALGPATPPISADLVDFSVDPEVTLGNYKSASGEATLMLIYYPNSQSAAEHLRRIDAAHHASDSQSGVATIENAGQFFDKRTGPIVAIAAGPISEGDARSLLGLVNYEARVTWNENTFFDKNNNIGTLIVNILLLCFIIGAMAIVAGFAFGGVRILAKRFFPDKVFDRPEQMEFISLHLAETAPDAGQSRVSELGKPSPPTQ
jgi:hypothetical protein